MIKRVGRRYLRFDKNVEGYARLSPAIQREFLTYSVVGLKKDEARIKERARELDEEIKRVSERKFDLVKRVIIDDIMHSKLKDLEEYIEENACFIIGGDVPLAMAHSDPRPASTGELVAGSDLDIIVITEDDFSGECFKRLDMAIYETKNMLLRQPTHKEEIDYLIKNIAKVRQQAKMETFEHLVACKIIHESKFLHGSRGLYEEVRDILKKNHVPEKLKRLEEAAIEYRKNAKEHLLKSTEISRGEYMKFFTTSEESFEIF
jgi:hypothetical protein